MIFKIISIFLIGMCVLAIFGRLRFPAVSKLKPKTCPSCGRFLIGKGPCACTKGKP